MIKIVTALLLLTTLGLSEHIQFESAYSDIDKNCKLIKNYENDMGGTVTCGKYANLNIEIFDDDMRASIDLIRDGKRHALDFSASVTPHFTQLGKKIEWRYPKGQSNNPTAMIVRLNITVEGETQAKKRIDSYLIVSKITKDKICTVEKIAPQKNQNSLAREFADKVSSLSCLLEREINERIY